MAVIVAFSSGFIITEALFHDGSKIIFSTEDHPRKEKVGFAVASNSLLIKSVAVFHIRLDGSSYSVPDPEGDEIRSTERTSGGIGVKKAVTVKLESMGRCKGLLVLFR